MKGLRKNVGWDCMHIVNMKIPLENGVDFFVSEAEIWILNFNFQAELEQIAIAMMMMAEEPERRRKLSAPMSTTIAVPSPEERRSIQIIKEAAISSTSSADDTDHAEDKLLSKPCFHFYNW